MTAISQPPSMIDRAAAAARTIWTRARGPVVAVGLLLWIVSAALGGPKGAGVGAVLTVAVAILALLWPGIRRWLLTASPTSDTPPRVVGPFWAGLADMATRTKTREIVTTCVMVAASIGLAVVAGIGGESALAVIVGLIMILGLIVWIKNRSLFFMFALAASFSLIMYKKFTPFLSESYAVAIYVTTVDVLLIVAYMVWAAEGTMAKDMRRGLRDPVFMLPMASAGLILLSAVNAHDQRLVWAEMLRYFFMTALFIYVGVRVRRREHIWALMLGWLVFLGVQVIVSTSQKVTGGFLGIPQFQLKPDPLEPALAAEYMRPYGTQIHPVFLGCVVSMVCALVACFALHIPRGRLARYALLSCIPLAFVPSFLAKARGPLVALVPTVIFILFFAIRRKFISGRIVLVGALLGLIGLGIFHSAVEETVAPLFGSSSNAGDNWAGRWQINLIGYRMVREHPIVGTGINSFERELAAYKYELNDFDYRPPHNLFVLMAAETGLLGLGVTIVIGLVYARYAYRLTKYSDPMYVSLGIGGLAMLVFVFFEELNSFTLKQDIPMAMFWTVFGLLVAANRMAAEGAPEMPGLSWTKPPRSRVTEGATDNKQLVGAES
jgi:O-antigen ligase